MTEGSFRRKKINFAQVSNYAMWDEELSLQAKGLYGLIASLINIPDFILYKTTLQKKAHIGKDAFHKYWTELKTRGYLIQYESRDDKGHIYYEYELLDKPDDGDTVSGKSVSGKQGTIIKQTAKNTKMRNTDLSQKNNKKEFIPPTLEEIKLYCLEINTNVDAEEFYDYYQNKNWPTDKEGNFDWKYKVRQWDRRAKKNEKVRVIITSDDIFNEEKKAQTLTIEELNSFYENNLPKDKEKSPNLSANMGEYAMALGGKSEKKELPSKEILMEKFSLSENLADYFIKNWGEYATKFI